MLKFRNTIIKELKEKKITFKQLLERGFLERGCMQPPDLLEDSIFRIDEFCHLLHDSGISSATHRQCKNLFKEVDGRSDRSTNFGLLNLYFMEKTI